MRSHLLRVAGLFGGRAGIRTNLELSPDYLTCPDFFNLGEICRIRNGDRGVGHTGGHTTGLGRGRQNNFSHLDAHGPLYSGFGCPLVGIVGSSQPNTLPTVACSSCLLDIFPDISPATGLPLGLIGTVKCRQIVGFFGLGGQIKMPTEARQPR